MCLFAIKVLFVINTDHKNRKDLWLIAEIQNKKNLLRLKSITRSSLRYLGEAFLYGSFRVDNFTRFDIYVLLFVFGIQYVLDVDIGSKHDLFEVKCFIDTDI